MEFSGFIPQGVAKRSSKGQHTKHSDGYVKILHMSPSGHIFASAKMHPRLVGMMLPQEYLFQHNNVR